MSRMVVRPPTTPAVVAQRLSDLLQCFPAAAIGGVQWRTLVRKYEERHGGRLDLAAVGQDTPLAAATALLWDVVRIVDSEDTDNPVVAVEDSIALSPQPSASASWPSLYQVLCRVAKQFGTVEHQDSSDTHGILVSQLKPLLQSHWHGDFNEGSLGYLTEEGTPIRLKKMKHLLQALLRWREQRVAWRAAAGAAATALDEALEPRLELVPSANHNDLVLRCVGPKCLTAAVEPEAPAQIRLTLDGAQCQARPACQSFDSSRSAEDAASEDAVSSAGSCTASSDLEQELAMLRAENAKLRMHNCILQHQAGGTVVAAASHAPAKPEPEPLLVEVFDDPFEPPPEACRSHSWCTARTTSPASTVVPRDFNFSPGTLTPMSGASGSSHVASGSATPATQGFGPGQQVCAFVPMCFTMIDRTQIPQGVVQQARAIFERGGPVLPSFFAAAQ